jgi:Cytochrome c554 and c-prime
MLLRRLLSDKAHRRLHKVINAGMRIIRHAAVPAVLLASFLLLSPLLRSQLPEAPLPATANGYVGDEACRSCHQQQFESYLGTAHHVASRLPSSTSISGKFTPGSSILRTTNPFLYFVMTASPDGFFQSAFAELPPSDTLSRRERFGLVIGSGRKGQTYLYWHGDQLFEMPVSYWTESGQWINSPGYSDGLPNFDKPIIPRCLECHTTYFHTLAPPANRFETENFVLGIACEKCHGPGQAHVARTQAHKPAGQSPDIVNPAKLPPQRQMDLCALCHAGPGTPRAPAFAFTAGQDLSRYLSITDAAPDTPADVHGHQVQQLSSSRCFRSAAITCATCHDVHQQQRDTSVLSARCLTCHKAESCGRFPAMQSRIVDHCIDCHMPLQTSNQIVFDTQGHQVRPQVRSHRIAIYRDAEIRSVAANVGDSGNITNSVIVGVH